MLQNSYENVFFHHCLKAKWEAEYAGRDDNSDICAFFFPNFPHRSAQCNYSILSIPFSLFNWLFGTQKFNSVCVIAIVSPLNVCVFGRSSQTVHLMQALAGMHACPHVEAAAAVTGFPPCNCAQWLRQSLLWQIRWGLLQFSTSHDRQMSALDLRLLPFVWPRKAFAAIFSESIS